MTEDHFLNIEKFIADRISNPNQDKGNISKPIVKIGIIGISLGVSVMFLTVSIVLGFKREILKALRWKYRNIKINIELRRLKKRIEL